jgi:hypothetical protein
MAVRTMDPRQVLQPVFLEGIMNKKMEQNLDFIDIFPRVKTDALSFSYFEDTTTAGADLTAGTMGKPNQLGEIGELSEIEVSSISMQHGGMERFGYQLRFSQRQLREEAVIDEISRAVDRAAFGMAKKMNDDVIAKLVAVTNDITEVDGAAAWDAAGATPVEDILSFVEASIVEGYPYELNELFLEKGNYFQLMKYLQGIDINWVRDPLSPEGRNMPVVNGVKINKLFSSQLAHASYIGLDNRYPAMTVYEYLDPKHSTLPGGMINVNKYEEERFPYNIVVEMYAERGLALKVPNAVSYKASNI